MSTRSGLIPILIALFCGIFAAAHVGKVPVALPVVQAELQLTLVQAGWVATAINAISALFGLASGVVAARLGSRAALMLGLALLTAGAAVGALSQDGSTLLGSRVLESVGMVLVTVSAPSLIAAAAPSARRGFWLTVWGCYMPLGMSAMMLLTPSLLAAGGWRTAWWFGAFLTGAALAVSWMARGSLPQPVTAAAPRLREQLRGALRLSGPWLMGVVFAAYSAQWFMIITWLPTFAIEHMGLTPREAGWLTAFATFCNVLGNLSAGPLARAGAPRWLVLVGVNLLLGSFGFLVFSADYHAGARLVLAVIACGAAGALPATVFAGVPDYARTPAEVAVGNGIVVQCINLAVFLGPPAIAAVVSHFGGWDAGRWLFPVIGAVGVVIALRLRELDTRRALACAA